MKVLILTPFYPSKKVPYHGIFFKDQALALSESQNVILVSASVDYHSGIHLLPSIKVTKNRENQNFLVNVVKVERGLPVVNQATFLFRSFQFLKELVIKENIDIIHSHYAYPAGYLAFLLKNRLKVPYIITEHSYYFEKRLRTPFHRRFAMKALRNADGLYAAGDYLADYIETTYDLPTGIIYNGIDIGKFSSGKRRNKADNKMVLGFLGRLNDESKGLHLLLKAVAEIAEFDISLNIGGDGSKKEDYIEMASELGILDRCIFHGAVAPEDVPDFLALNNAFVMPSYGESFGVVVVEALASGLPVIATKCGGPEFILTEETGIVIEKGNYLELKEAIIELYRNYGSYDADLCHEHARKYFGYGTLSQNLVTAYKKVLVPG